MADLYVPPDAEAWTEEHADQDNKGACGPCLLAALLGRTVTQVVAAWPTPWKGYAAINAMRKLLECEGGGRVVHHQVTELGGQWPTTGRGFFRLQWYNPASPDGSWPGQEHLTAGHLMAFREVGGTMHLYCNEWGGWRQADSDDAQEYLSLGKVTAWYVWEED